MSKASKRPFSFGLGFLIFLLPVPLALLTLGSGRSTRSRVLAFGWLAFLIVGAAFERREFVL